MKGLYDSGSELFDAEFRRIGRYWFERSGDDVRFNYEFDGLYYEGIDLCFDFSVFDCDGVILGMWDNDLEEPVFRLGNSIEYWELIKTGGIKFSDFETEDYVEDDGEVDLNCCWRVYGDGRRELWGNRGRDSWQKLCGQRTKQGGGINPHTGKIISDYCKNVSMGSGNCFMHTYKADKRKQLMIKEATTLERGRRILDMVKDISVKYDREMDINPRESLVMSEVVIKIATENLNLDGMESIQKAKRRIKDLKGTYGAERDRLIGEIGMLLEDSDEAVVGLMNLHKMLQAHVDMSVKTSNMELSKKRTWTEKQVIAFVKMFSDILRKHIKDKNILSAIAEEVGKITSRM